MDALDRLYWRLVETLRSDGAIPEDALTVARLYQTIIPYRGIRAELGLLELAQYEHALLRLLSGERGYLVLDPAGAQEELRRELAAPNPILGIYRDYADAAVRLNRAPAQPPAPAITPASERPIAVPAEPAAAAAAAVQRQAPTAAPAAAPAVACTSCREVLPRGRAARFCPFCGTRQPERCRGCGGALEEQWRFCIDCGDTRESHAAAPAGA